MNEEIIRKDEEQFNPFPGLRPFESNEAHLFFGRDGQSHELVKRLKKTRFLAVVGTSGSGKSSLVRAGLLPLLHCRPMTSEASGWLIALFPPGDDPIGSLAIALGSKEVFWENSPQLTQGSSDLPRSPKLVLETDKQHLLTQAVIIETTLRRSTLGIIEVAREARMEPHENLLIVVDQFEELFRLKGTSTDLNSQDDAAAFIKLLLEASWQRELPIYVVLTMRSEFLGECAQFRDLPEAINDGQYLIPRMTRDERREAITEPVAVGGGQIALRLVQRLLNDVGDDPDQLPILQHALMRTWDYWMLRKQDGEPIDLRHYEEIGTMTNALSQHADEAYKELDEHSKRIAEKLFKCLTEKGPYNREIRRPRKLRQICAVADAKPKEVIEVIDKFRTGGRTFLMPPHSSELNEECVIDISHESLIRQWGRLRKWVEEEAESRASYLRLVEDGRLYKKDKSSLYRHPELKYTLDWKALNQPNEAWAEFYTKPGEFDLAMEFLDKSVKRANLKKVGFIILLLILLGLTLVISSFLIQNEQTKMQRDKAVEQERIAKEEKIKADKAVKFANKQRKIAEMEQVKAYKLLVDLLKEFGWESKRLTSEKYLSQSAVQQAVEASINANQALRQTANAGYEGRRNDVKVQYFPKDVDGTQVEAALRGLGFKFDIKNAPLQAIATNSIWFSTPVNIQDVQIVAYTLIRAGVQIKSIRPLLRKYRNKKVIQVGALRDAVNCPALTVEMIKKARQFSSLPSNVCTDKVINQ